MRLTRHVLIVLIHAQKVHWFVAAASPPPSLPSDYRLSRTFRASTSRFGVGQVRGSFQTPLGLHRIAEKVGGGWPPGTVFKGRRPVGTVSGGFPEAPIAHRILWLEGLQPGLNRGGEVDSYNRFIYIHGLGNEPTLGRPASSGCIHLAASDLVPLFNRVPQGSLVWITLL